MKNFIQSWMLSPIQASEFTSDKIPPQLAVNYRQTDKMELEKKFTAKFNASEKKELRPKRASAK
jgi:hypothetical protein